MQEEWKTMRRISASLAFSETDQPSPGTEAPTVEEGKTLGRRNRRGSPVVYIGCSD